MRLIQLTGASGDHVGLYTTENKHEKIDDQKVFDLASQLAELVTDAGDDLIFHEVLDDFLVDAGYHRILADVVTTEKL